MLLRKVPVPPGLGKKKSKDEEPPAKLILALPCGLSGCFGCSPIPPCPFPVEQGIMLGCCWAALGFGGCLPQFAIGAR